jgi:hypothetical protein
MKCLISATLAVALSALLPPVAQAQLLTTSSESNTQSSQSAYDSFISTNDLLAGLTPVSTTTPSLGFPLTGINDGAADANVVGPTSHETWFEGGANFDPSNHSLNSNPVVTFTFSTPMTITSLQSIYGWNDNNSFNDQDYTILYTLASNPSLMLTLGSVAYNPFEPSNDFSGFGPQGASMVDLSVSGLTNVKSISFEFTPYISSTSEQEQGGQMIREIDVFGSPDVESVPEPSTWVLMLGGVGFLVFLTRRNLLKV